MLASLCWVPRGAARTKFPDGVDDSADMDVSYATPQGRDIGGASKDTEALGKEHIPGDDSDSDVDVAEILAADLNKLAFYKRNQNDPYLEADPKANELFDEEELDDLTVRKTDSLVISVKCSEDVSTLETHVFDDNPYASDDEEGIYVPHTYVHHEVVLPSLPLCSAYTALTSGDQIMNFVAVGMFSPGIDVWDIDRVNNLEPVQSLGGYETSSRLDGALRAAAKARKGKNRKQKKKPSIAFKEGSHRDAVMCLSWNKVQREYLASGSADTTVKIWDIESAHCACTVSHHEGKVQSVAFHPSKDNILLSGSFDKTVRMLDLRDQAKTSAWNVATDIETCNWVSGPAGDLIICTTEDGYATVFDPRGTSANNAVTSWCVHNGPASACSVSGDIPGLMASGGVDKMLRIWDISSVYSGKPGELIYERNAKGGALFSVSLCPLPGRETNASPFVVAVGGAKGSLGVIDVGVESEAVRDRFLRHCPPPAANVIRKRAQRDSSSKSTAKRRPMTQGLPQSDSSDEGSDSPDSDSAHED